MSNRDGLAGQGTATDYCHGTTGVPSPSDVRRMACPVCHRSFPRSMSLRLLLPIHLRSYPVEQGTDGRVVEVVTQEGRRSPMYDPKVYESVVETIQRHVYVVPGTTEHVGGARDVARHVLEVLEAAGAFSVMPAARVDGELRESLSNVEEYIAARGPSADPYIISVTQVDGVVILTETDLERLVEAVRSFVDQAVDSLPVE